MACAARSAVLPLAGHQIFATRDVDEARERVARVFCPHRLATVAPRRALDARQHSAPLGPSVSLNYVQYGPAVDIEPGCLGSFYLLQIPLHGGAQVRCGGQRVVADARTASLPSPSEPLAMRWDDDSPHLIVQFGLAAVERQWQQLAQAPLDGPLVFDLGLRLDAPAMAPLLHYVHYLCGLLDGQTAFAQVPQLAEQAEHYLLSTLLLLAPHNRSRALVAPARHGVLPRSVRRAQDYMQAAGGEPVSLAQLCQHVGVSARALQTAFLAHTGQSPMAWWRGLRLQQARTALRAGGASASVSRIAAEHGFVHLGRFAEQYRQRFGETPAQTLRASR